MARNFYVVLGVSRDADPSQIRRAHRRLVRLHHPDTATGSVERFAEVQEAYETLSDEESKRLYDDSLPPNPVPLRRGARARTNPPAVERRVSRQGLPDVYAHGDEPKPLTLQDTAPGLWGTIDEFLEGWLPGFFTTGRTASRRKDLYVEIILDPEEAARGGMFPLDIPVRELCEKCAATGYIGLFICENCGGRAVVPGRRQVEISMPAGVADGTEAHLSLEDIGLKGVDLNVLVSIRS